MQGKTPTCKELESEQKKINSQISNINLSLRQLSTKYDEQQVRIKAQEEAFNKMSAELQRKALEDAQAYAKNLEEIRQDFLGRLAALDGAGDNKSELENLRQQLTTQFEVLRDDVTKKIGEVQSKINEMEPNKNDIVQSYADMARKAIAAPLEEVQQDMIAAIQVLTKGKERKDTKQDVGYQDFRMIKQHDNNCTTNTLLHLFNVPNAEQDWMLHYQQCKEQYDQQSGDDQKKNIQYRIQENIIKTFKMMNSGEGTDPGDIMDLLFAMNEIKERKEQFDLRLDSDGNVESCTSLGFADVHMLGFNRQHDVQEVNKHLIQPMMEKQGKNFEATIVTKTGGVNTPIRTLITSATGIVNIGEVADPKEWLKSGNKANGKYLFLRWDPKYNQKPHQKAPLQMTMKTKKQQYTAIGVHLWSGEDGDGHNHCILRHINQKNWVRYNMSQKTEVPDEEMEKMLRQRGEQMENNNKTKRYEIVGVMYQVNTTDDCDNCTKQTCGKTIKTAICQKTSHQRFLEEKDKKKKDDEGFIEVKTFIKKNDLEEKLEKPFKNVFNSYGRFSALETLEEEKQHVLYSDGTTNKKNGQQQESRADGSNDANNADGGDGANNADGDDGANNAGGGDEGKSREGKKQRKPRAKKQYAKMMAKLKSDTEKMVKEAIEAHQKATVVLNVPQPSTPTKTQEVSVVAPGKANGANVVVPPTAKGGAKPEILKKAAPTTPTPTPQPALTPAQQLSKQSPPIAVPKYKPQHGGEKDMKKIVLEKEEEPEWGVNFRRATKYWEYYHKDHWVRLCGPGGRWYRSKFFHGVSYDDNRCLVMAQKRKTTNGKDTPIYAWYDHNGITNTTKNEDSVNGNAAGVTKEGETAEQMKQDGTEEDFSPQLEALLQKIGGQGGEPQPSNRRTRHWIDSLSSRGMLMTKDVVDMQILREREENEKKNQEYEKKMREEMQKKDDEINSLKQRLGMEGEKKQKE